MNKTIDINCDVGEGFDNEAELMPYISSCNIACGSHAGDIEMINKTIKLALKHNVKVGAHPSFPDKENFGRVIIDIASAELQLSLENQISLVKSAVESLGGKLNHAKPHGALYNLAAKDEKIAQIVIDAVKNTAEEVFLYVPYQSKIAELAQKSGLKTKIEAFADRNYNTDLTLVSRKFKNAVIIDKELLVEHLLKIIENNEVISIDGVGVKIEADTYCFHGDNPSAISLLKHTSKMLQEQGVKIE